MCQEQNHNAGNKIFSRVLPFSQPQYVFASVCDVLLQVDDMGDEIQFIS